MDNVSSSAQSAAQRAASRFDSVADNVTQRARDVMDDVAERAGRASDWVREQKIAENASAYVSSNPAKALGAAVVAGALLAYLFTRKKNWP